MSQTELVNKGKSPSDLIEFALKNKGDLEKLEKLLEIQIKYEENEAKKAYHEAMAQFKSSPPKITKDKENKQYKTMYTTLGNLVNTVNPELSKYGLSASWDIQQDTMIKVTCKITHRLGHSEITSASAPSDTSGSKNPIQQIKSTITYLKSVTFESITGLASTDANLDDDGNRSETSLSDLEIEEISRIIKEKNLNVKKLCDYMGVAEVKEIKSNEYKKALAAVKNAPAL